MPRVQQHGSMLNIQSDWFSLLVPGVWEIKDAAFPKIFQGNKGARTLSLTTHTLPATPNTELRTLALRGILDEYARAETNATLIEEGPVESSPGGAIVTLAYSLKDSEHALVVRVKLVCYGRRCVAARLSSDLKKQPDDSLDVLESDLETILDGLSLLQFERISVAYLQRRMTLLLAVNLFLFCSALLIAAQCYYGEQNIDLSSLRQKSVAIQDAESGRAAMRESVEFFDFWFDRAATFRKEIAAILLVVGGAAGANIAAFWWMRRVLRHPWDDIVERE